MGPTMYYVFLWCWSPCSCRPLCWEGSRQTRGMLEPLHTFSKTTSDWVGLIKHLKYMTIYKQFAFSFLWVIPISWMAKYILYGILQLSLFSSSNCSLFQCPSLQRLKNTLSHSKPACHWAAWKRTHFYNCLKGPNCYEGTLPVSILSLKLTCIWPRFSVHIIDGTFRLYLPRLLIPRGGRIYPCEWTMITRPEKDTFICEVITYYFEIWFRKGSFPANFDCWISCILPVGREESFKWMTNSHKRKVVLLNLKNSNHLDRSASLQKISPLATLGHS